MATVRELVTKILFKTDKNSLKQAEKSIEKLKSSLGGLGKTAKASGDSANGVMRNLISSGQQAGNTIQTAMNQARKSIEGVKQSALQTSSALNTVRGSASNVKVVAPTPVAQQSTQKKKLTGGDVATAGATAMVAGTAITAPLVNAVDDAKDFEYAMKRVQAVTQADEEALKKLSEQARMLGRATEFNAKQVADAQYYLGLAGWKTNQILSATPSLLRLSIAGGTDLARVADIISDDMTAMGIAIDKDGKSVQRFADIFASTMSNSNTNIEMMGETMKYAGTIAGTLGYKMEDVALAIGLMANNGTKASEAGTALRAMMTRLSAPPKETAEAFAQIAKETGIMISPIDELTGKVKPLREVFIQMRNALKNYDEVQRVAFGKQIAGMYGTAGFNAIVKSTDEDFNKLVNAIDNADGASERMANTMQDNLRGSLIATKSAMYDLNVEVGKSMTPALRNATGGLTGMLNGATDLAKEFPRLTSAVSIFGGILGGLLVGLGAIGIAVGGILTLAGAVGVGLSAPVVAGIVAIIAIVSALIANLDLVKAKFGEWKAVAEEKIESVKAKFGEWKSYAEEQFNSVKATIGEWQAFAGEKIDFVKGKFNEFKTSVQNGIDSVIKKMNEMKSMAEAPLSFVKGLLDAIVNPLETLCSLLDRAKTGFANLISNAESGAVQKYKQITAEYNQNNTVVVESRADAGRALREANSNGFLELTPDF